MNKFQVTVEEDTETGDLVLPLPEELLEQMDWHPGDTLVWKDNSNGTYSLYKADSELQKDLDSCQDGC